MNTPITWNDVVVVWLLCGHLVMVGGMVVFVVAYPLLRYSKPRDAIRSDGDNLDGDDPEIEKWRRP